MRGKILRAGGMCLTWCLLAPFGSHDTGPAAGSDRRMSFHNRLLLNRAVVNGLESIEVLLLAAPRVRQPGTFAEIGAAVASHGGRVLRKDDDVGYLRVEVPSERLLDVVAAADVEAYQITSLSRGAWYRDGPPLSNAQMFRGFEVTPIAPVKTSSDRANLPVLSPAEALDPGFTADDAGVGEWLTNHPAFDGRGVTVALLESALPAFLDPALRGAMTLDGRQVSKLAGIVNAIPAGQADETRVALTGVIDSTRTWARFGKRTYVLPHPGRFRAGTLDVPAGPNLVHQFAVVEDQQTQDVWIDSNGDGSFQDERPLADVNERFEPRLLELSHPARMHVSFVMGRGREPHVVHVYIGKGSHQTMTVSVAAGSRTTHSLAAGVAPNARVLLVRMQSSDPGLARTFEAFLDTIRRPEVDLISVSGGLTIVPDTAADFAGAFFSRLIAKYNKPIINAAGNTSLALVSAHAYGDMLSAGGAISPPTYAALHGGGTLDDVIVHPISAAGPALDGAIKPDFLAPMERIAAGLPWSEDLEVVARSHALRRLPSGYQVSCCTSATSPYAAGVAALLISAAKQSHVAYSADRISRALRTSARLIRGYQAHEQGNGLLNVNAAWLALTSTMEPPRISATAKVVHPLAQYAVHGTDGRGILEFEGWVAGMTGTRTLALRRESGPAEPITYRVAWSATDGTFTSPSSVTLPLGTIVPFPVAVRPAASGVHSALLDLRDRDTDAIVFRSQATVVAAERFDPAVGFVRVNGTVKLMRQQAHYFDVPPGTGAVAFELEVVRGVVQPTILQSHGLSGDYYMQVHPLNTFVVGPGRYHVVMPDPEPGTWTVRLDNRSVWLNLSPSFGPRDESDAEYTLMVRLLRTSVLPSKSHDGTIAVDMVNTGDAIREPVLESHAGWIRSHRVTSRRNGLPNVIEIDVPRDAVSLSLHLRSDSGGPNGELYLYECTTGECFSYDIAFPAARSQRLVVRKPAPGRWIAAVNAAPFPDAEGSFVLDEIIATGALERWKSDVARRPADRWRQVVEPVPALAGIAGTTPILLLELVDDALEREEREHPWSTAPHYVPLRDRPVALGKAILR